MVWPIEELDAWFGQWKSEAHGTANTKVKCMVQPLKELGAWYANRRARRMVRPIEEEELGAWFGQ